MPWLKWVLLVMTGLLAACGSTPERGDDGLPPAGKGVPETADAVVRDEPRSRYGNPDSYEVFGKRYYVLPTAAGYRERGIASWYGTKFHGRRTSSGERYDMYRMTAAHKTLPLPAYVEVINLRNGRRAVMKVNDRGPFHEGRIIDLSYAAALKLDIVGTGTGFVEVRALTPEEARRPRSRIEDEPPAASSELRSEVSATRVEPRTAPRAFIQLGAFREPGNAERLVQRISQELNLQARVSTPVPGGGDRFFRVRIGPFDDTDAVDAVLERLRSDAGLGEATVVVEP